MTSAPSLLDNVNFDDNYQTSDFNRKVGCSRAIHAVVDHVSNANVCSRMLDAVPLTLSDDILLYEASSTSCIQDNGITSGSSSSEAKIV